MAGDLLDMFNDEPRIVQARTVSEWIRELANVTQVALRSGNHGNAGRQIAGTGFRRLRVPVIMSINMPLDFSRPFPVLRALFPGSFPEIPLRPETRRERLPRGLWSTEEAAESLCVAPETLRRLCRRKAITFIQVTPSEYRFALTDLEEYVASRRNKRASGVR
jgi:excisionase family DNA binding protein